MAERRRYSLFRKSGSRWVQISKHTFEKENAVRYFQNQLLSEPGLMLRPVPKVGDATPLPFVCSDCYKHLHTHCAGGQCTCACRMFKSEREGGESQ